MTNPDVTTTVLWAAPTASSINATVQIPGSKSLSNRFLILAALSQKPVVLRGLLRSRDTELMMQALSALGVQFEVHDDDTTVTVIPPQSGVFKGNTSVYCGLAGTVMRFVPALAYFADGPVHFDGDKQAYVRPMKPILDGLVQMGAQVNYEGEIGYLPFTITPPKEIDDERSVVRIDSSASSQFISGLLLVASKLPGGMRLTHIAQSLPSLPHIYMTMHDVELAGGNVSVEEDCMWTVYHRDLQLPQDLIVEPDLSNAAPFLGAALIAGGSVSIPHWPYHTTQPGGLLPGILQKMGAQVFMDGVELEVDGSFSNDNNKTFGTLTVRGKGEILGLGEFDMAKAGEIAPSIAAISTLANSDTTIVGIGHLRGHETNRLEALVNEITRVGAHATELKDGISIQPVEVDKLHGAVMHTYADHRMATFAAMLGLKIQGIQVENIATTSKTMPDFPNMWKKMLEH